MTSRIFISYRRGLSGAAAGRLYDHLLEHFGAEAVFMDVDGIEPGADFVATLEQQLSRCETFLAVIGPGWTEAKDATGRRRLDDPRDYVRLEIEAALQRDVRVIPVLVDGAVMPSPNALPSPLASLARRQAVEIAHQHFVADVEQLARSLEHALGRSSEPANAVRRVGSGAHAEAGRPPGREEIFWVDLLFSFNGRISRKPYWLGTGVVLAVAFLLESALVAALLYGLDTRALDMGVVAPVMLIAGLPFAWPVLALFMKRLRDIGQGWLMCASLAALKLAAYGLYLAGYPMQAMIPACVGFGAVAMLGVVETSANEPQ